MPEQNSVIELINAIESKLEKVHTQSLDLSFNEILDMKKEGELRIDPEFQRVFRWSEGARSRFIESLLLEMPVPPIYVIEEEDGKYLLIDGLQRISSYLHLRGELVATHLDPAVNQGDKLRLTDCDIVTELNGKTFEELGSALQIRLKRAFVRVEVVRKGSDPRFKYHMFKRLNTGGQLLSEQQIRNCTIRLLNVRFNEFIIDLSKRENFKTCIQNLTSEQFLDAYDQELVLRYFALKNYRDNFKHDLADFLTDYMEGVSDPDISLPFDYEKEEENFETTFAILANSMGELAFGYANKKKKIVRGFGIYQFEAFAIGLQASIAQWNSNDEASMQRLKELITEIKTNDTFIGLVTGGGKNSSGQLRERIQFVERMLVNG
ncbi:DUF262 domain-containing protein [Paraflavitalea sp. CAU 1676]|uniref:DUF262 domain-containing protein n=1 Tax=Paraflavitalea sp. CAU 1676 TaxID=3032598 RepID=UPI0023DB47A2|nr:DUF262 domain-containing protein [Paraflavitalea sp. CAU 1676]MDF2190318.1 DUF262 domain-containing protein [Paraflavitalea sp. CAU 1676]